MVKVKELQKLVPKSSRATPSDIELVNSGTDDAPAYKVTMGLWNTTHAELATFPDALSATSGCPGPGQDRMGRAGTGSMLACAAWTTTGTKFPMVHIDGTNIMADEAQIQGNFTLSAPHTPSSPCTRP